MHTQSQNYPRAVIIYCIIYPSKLDRTLRRFYTVTIRLANSENNENRQSSDSYLISVVPLIIAQGGPHASSIVNTKVRPTHDLLPTSLNCIQHAIRDFPQATEIDSAWSAVRVVCEQVDTRDWK